MNIKEDLLNELNKYGFDNEEDIRLEEIRNQDGVCVYKAEYGNKSYVLKYFYKEEYRREIENYSILRGLDIPTIKVFGNTDKSILLEDIDKSEEYRLGIAADLSDIEVARALAEWYIKLHNEGEKYIIGKKDKFYREINSITRENIELVKYKSKTQDNKVWDLIVDNLDFVLNNIKSLPETLNYNDFYWTNFVVREDKKKALMFDYNFLGIGLRYNDIRNVCSSLSDEAGNVFLEAYGGIDERERSIDECMSILISLIFAYQRPEFPGWAQEALEAIDNGKLEKSFNNLLELF